VEVDEGTAAAYALVYDEALRAMSEQHTVLEDLRSRAGVETDAPLPVALIKRDPPLATALAPPGQTGAVGDPPKRAPNEHQPSLEARKPTSEGRLSRCGVPLRALGKISDEMKPRRGSDLVVTGWFPSDDLPTSPLAWEIGVNYQGGEKG
jgi:hypothetical protein